MFQDQGDQPGDDQEQTAPSPWESAHWSRLQQLFHLAEAAPAEERPRILQAACSDPRLIEPVLELLALSADGPGADTQTSSTVPLGTHVGTYALLQHLGTGGLGSVYLAERLVGGAVQKCALKVLSMHAAGPQFEARFQREQQILASLNHPDITRLLDAGISDTGQPYLVMEYVDGVDLSTYCDAHKLTVPKRIDLFLQICAAVSYAHRNLTVHLDLKPSNIMVTREGTVKLLDFGTAKLIDPDHGSTTTIMATPAYASPEQLRGQAVTTSCDVYALGVILFELLSGQRPFHGAPLAMVVERALHEQEPSPLTTAVTAEGAEVRGTSTLRLRQMLEGDLATIVARCLRSRPADRYTSVDALSDDLKRYCEGRPVLARPQTQTYRLSKFVRRNRRAVAIAAIAGLLVVGSLSYAALRQHQALQAAQRAVQMQTFMTHLFRLAHSGATGKPAATVAELLQVGAQVLPTFIPDPADQRIARLSIAESMYDDDDFKDALPMLLALAEEARRDHDIPVEAKADVLAGDIQYTMGQAKEGDRLTTRALALSPNRGIAPADHTQIVAMYVSNHDDAGDRTERSMQLLRTAIGQSERAHVPEQETASAMNILGLGLQARGHLEEAAQYFQRSLAIYQRAPYAKCDLAATEKYLGYLRDKAGDSAGALSMMQQSYELQRTCAGADDLATLSSQAWVATELNYLGRSAEAAALLEPALPQWRKVGGAESPHLSTPLSVLARAYLNLGRCSEAEVASRGELHAVRSFQKISARNALAESHLAEALVCEHQDAQALPFARAAVADYPPVSTTVARGRETLGRMKQDLADLQARLDAASKTTTAR